MIIINDCDVQALCWPKTVGAYRRNERRNQNTIEIGKVSVTSRELDVLQ